MGTARTQVVRRRSARRVAAGAALLVLSLAACGGGGDGDDSAAETTAAETTVAAVETTAVATETTVAADTSAPAETTVPGAAPVFTGAAADVEAALRRRVDAYNRADGEAYVKTFSTARLDELGAQASGIDAKVSGGADRIRLVGIRGIDIDGATATVVVEVAVVPATDETRVATIVKNTETWVAEAGTWKFDQAKVEVPDLPAGVTPAEVRVDDGKPLGLPETMPGGQAAFRFVNVGGQTHQVYLLALAPGVDLPAYLQKLSDPATADPGPEGRQLATSGALTTGTERLLVLTGPLPAGRYLLLCASEQSSDAPHGLTEYATFDVA